MKSEFKTKLIQHLLNSKNSEKGFTLIELLVVIIIIGILAAIALPSFLNQANKARESEAKTYTGSVNRGQQAYFLEQRGFTGSISSLGLGLAIKTANYEYISSTQGTGNGGAAIPASALATDPKQLAQYINNYGKPTTAAVKGFVGTTYVATTTGGEQTTIAVLCGTKTPNSTEATSTVVTGFNAYTGLSTTTTTRCGDTTTMENLDK